MKWNNKRISLQNWGSAPTVIEPVKGQVTLRNLKPHKGIEVIPLDGAGKSLGKSIDVNESPTDLKMSIGEPATTWYLINVKREEAAD